MLKATSRAVQPPAPILRANDLVLVSAETGTTLVGGVSLSLAPGETLAVVGESGSGKSLTALSLLDLLPRGVNRIGGEVYFEGAAIGGAEKGSRALRGRSIAAIFQDPQASLDPRWTVGRYLCDRFMRLGNMTQAEARSAAVTMLAQVGLADPNRILKSYPHELSGGMAQRVMIAGALAGNPRILIADEPTTALDVTTQAQILDLLSEIQSRTGLGILLITHDLGVVAEVADRVLVLYGGTAMESGDVSVVLDHPRHPYTRALLTSMPDLGSTTPPLPIPAGPIRHEGCPFAGRCRLTMPACIAAMPPRTDLGDGATYACHIPPAAQLPVREKIHATR